MPIEVPATFAEVTTDWLAAALAEGGVLDVDVATSRVEPMAAGKGLIGDLATVHVTYSRGIGPSSFVVKLPAENPSSRRIGDMLRAYAREVAFYRHVAPHAGAVPLAKCFYTGDDESAGRWALVIESIDADSLDFLVGASPAQANAAVDALADFHALWWDASSIHDWMPGFDVTGVGGLQPLWLHNLPTFVDRYRNVLPGSSAQWVLDFAPKLGAWSAAAADQPLTMVHSDYRLDNLLFRGQHVTIIDWQTAMRAPAAMDLTCFIATSLSIEARRRSEAELVERYLERLARHGPAVDRAWFLQSYDENLLWWMGQFGNNLAHLDPGDARIERELATMAERVYTAGLDHAVERLL